MCVYNTDCGELGTASILRKAASSVKAARRGIMCAKTWIGTAQWRIASPQPLWWMVVMHWEMVSDVHTSQRARFMTSSISFGVSRIDFKSTATAVLSYSEIAPVLRVFIYCILKYNNERYWSLFISLVRTGMQYSRQRLEFPKFTETMRMNYSLRITRLNNGVFHISI